jgi:hypothetical protein
MLAQKSVPSGDLKPQPGARQGHFWRKAGRFSFADQAAAASFLPTNLIIHFLLTRQTLTVRSL